LIAKLRSGNGKRYSEAFPRKAQSDNERSTFQYRANLSQRSFCGLTRRRRGYAASDTIHYAASDTIHAERTLSTLLQKGNELLKLSRFDDAYAAFSHALRASNSTSYAAAYGAGRAAGGMRDFEKAMGSFAIAAKI